MGVTSFKFSFLTLENEYHNCYFVEVLGVSNGLMHAAYLGWALLIIGHPIHINDLLFFDKMSISPFEIPIDRAATYFI